MSPDHEPLSAPRVSIIVNNFNYARFLPQCIGSALGQTYEHTEVIVVDDASTDDSHDVIRSFGDRVIPVLQARNAGQAAAMNAGFAASRGEVIIYLDADDYLYPAAAERVASAFRPGIGIVQYRLHMVDADGKVLGLCPASAVRFDRGDVVPKVLATGRYDGTVTSGMAYARSTLGAVLPIPAETFRIAADGYLASAAPFHGEVGAIEDPLGAYRLHGGNNWALAGVDLARNFRRLLMHDADKHRVIAEQAALRGLPSVREPGLHDYQHVGVRLGSCLLDPEGHPFPEDRRWRLGVLGAAAALRAGLPRRQRVFRAGVYLALGVMPRPLALALHRWIHVPESRPPAVARMVPLLRGLWT